VVVSRETHRLLDLILCIDFRLNQIFNYSQTCANDLPTKNTPNPAQPLLALKLPLNNQRPPVTYIWSKTDSKRAYDDHFAQFWKKVL